MTAHIKDWLIQSLCVVEWDICFPSGQELKKRKCDKGGTDGSSSHVSQLNHKITSLRPFVGPETLLSCTESKLISINKAPEENIMPWWLWCIGGFLIVHYRSNTHTHTHTHTNTVWFSTALPTHTLFQEIDAMKWCPNDLCLWCLVFLWLTF